MRTENAVRTDEKNTSKVITAMVAIVISMIISIGFTLTLGSSFGIEFKFYQVFLGVLVISAFYAVLFLNAKKWMCFTALISAPIILTICVYFDKLNVKKGIYALLYYIKMYVFLWMPGDFPEDPDAPKTVLAFITAYYLTAIGVLMLTLIKKKLIPAALVFYIPFFLCSVMNTDVPPKATPFLTALTGVILVLLCHAFRNKKQITFDKVIAILVVPVFAFMMLLGGIFPQKGYNKDKLAQNILVEMKDRVEKAVGYDSPLRELFEKALNGLDGTDFDDSFDAISPLYATSTNLSNVGPFNPTTAEILKVYRSRNPEYKGIRTPYEGNVLYLKVESMDTYRNNTLSASGFKGSPYIKDVDPEYEAAQYGITVTPLHSAAVDVVPYYTDFYKMGTAARKRLNPYTSTHERIFYFASANIPVKTGNIYSEKYLNEYVYKTCLEVPYSTDRSLINSDALPEWFKDVYYGRTKMSDAEKVREVTKFVRDLHPYDTHTPYPPKGEDFVPWFVKEANSGICVHYAVTSVVLLRMLGVPTRYVRGFIDMNSGMDKESIVYASQAHAWFEFFTPEYGWVIGDATPGYGIDEANFNIDAIAKAHPEINDSDFRNTDTDEPEKTETETSEETTATSSTEPGETTSPESESESATEPEPTMQTTVLPDGEIIYFSNGTDHPADQGAKEKFELPDYVKNLFRLILTVIVIAAVIAAVVLAVRVVFVISWKNRFSAKTVNGRAIAYYHYYDLMGRLFKVVIPPVAAELAEKAAFSGKELSAKEYNTLISACRKALDDSSRDFSRYKSYAYKLLRIHVTEPKQK